ncbi:expressed unknown protein [Seminavis robusta]|uniref:Uncharacterized protein n=1 Tax=Seminavis robusta TaxID=568900 RepID=A0A9N8D799_9STRA|nr:expressed unknown protein [Seminavis robusta]|eukprot:Sro24_g016620.1 n/a (298) ;mRNA; f:156867-157760
MNNPNSKLNLSFSQLFHAPSVTFPVFGKVPEDTPTNLKEEDQVGRKGKRSKLPSMKSKSRSSTSQRRSNSRLNDLSNSDRSIGTPSTTMEPNSSSSSFSLEKDDLIGDGGSRISHFHQQKKNFDKIKEQVRRVSTNNLSTADLERTPRRSRIRRSLSAGENLSELQNATKPPRHGRSRMAAPKSPAEPPSFRRTVSDRRNYSRRTKSKGASPPSVVGGPQDSWRSESSNKNTASTWSGGHTAETWTCNCGFVLKERMQYCGMCGAKKHWTCDLCSFDENLNIFCYCGGCGTARCECQ